MFRQEKIDIIDTYIFLSVTTVNFGVVDDAFTDVHNERYDLSHVFHAIHQYLSQCTDKSPIRISCSNVCLDV